MSKVTIDRYEIDGITFSLEEKENFGKVTVSPLPNINSSCIIEGTYVWGAMGKSLKEFLTCIDEEYFADKFVEKLVSSNKVTKRNIRNHISGEIIPWYQEMVFQKHFREKFNNFMTNEMSSGCFVDSFPGFIDSLDYSLLENSYWEQEFKLMKSECWYFIGYTYSPEFKKLGNVFKKLKKKLSKEIEKEKVCF